jgi:predicted nucleic acid-binding protein
VVVDASITVRVCLAEPGFADLQGRQLVAPPLLWIETSSVLHELQWRGEITARLAQFALERLRSSPITERRPRRLIERAWDVAEELGWAKLYDAHYVALAQLMKLPLLTLDGRLLRGAGRVVETVGPRDL